MTTPSITIRPAAAGDAERLAVLLVAQLREHDIPTPAAHVSASITAMLRDPDRGFILVASVGGVVEGVAYVSFADPLEHAGTVAWLEELYVVPERRNLGLGGELVTAVMARAEERGCVSVELEVEEAHARAAHLYARHGFRPMRRTHWVQPLGRWDW